MKLHARTIKRLATIELPENKQADLLVSQAEATNAVAGKLQDSLFYALQSEEGKEAIKVAANILLEKHGSQGPLQAFRTALQSASVIVPGEDGNPLYETKTSKDGKTIRKLVKDSGRKVTIQRTKGSNGKLSKQHDIVTPTKRESKVQNKEQQQGEPTGMLDLTAALVAKFGLENVLSVMVGQQGYSAVEDAILNIGIREQAREPRVVEGELIRGAETAHQLVPLH